uniref:Cytochrome P450 n=1 Tax=Anoplophora glabripennis TaxID=217634 RepID=A0A8F8QQG0_ANOGL|nr:cytochrome P450 [Anoplophora glabripennis]
MMLIIILVTILIFLLTYTFWKNMDLPPGPWGLPVLGYLPWIDSKAPYLTFTQLSKKYGSIYGLSLGSIYTVVVTEPKVIKHLFFKDATIGRAPLYLTHGIMKGYGLICAEGELWKEQRRFVHHCLREFGGSKIGFQRKKMEALIMENVMDFVNFVESQGDKSTLDPLEPLRHSLGSAMNILVFGKSWSRDDKTWKWLQHLQEEGTQHIGVAGPLNFLPFLRFHPKFGKTMDFLISGKLETHKVYKKIIQEQAEYLKNRAQGDSSTDTNSITNITQAFLAERERRKDEPEILEKFYNDQQFYHLLADIFGAGLDTTLTTLRWYLLYLAKNPAIQRNIRIEIHDVLQNNLPTIEDIVHLPLVEASIYEAQRIRSVVPVGIPHGATEEVEVDGFRIPQGSMIVPLQWAVHMNENMWPDPEKFDPSRFINEEGKVVRNSYFMPYQIGKRMCVGDELARMMLYLFGATILQKFSVELEDEHVDLIGVCGITLTPNSHKLIFSKVSSK